MGLFKRLEAIEMVLVLNEDGKAALEAKRAEYTTKLNELYNNGEGTEAGVLAKVDYDAATEAIKNALTEEELATALENANSKLMTPEQYEIYKAIEDAKAELRTQFPAENYTVYAEELNAELIKADEALRKCTTVAEVDRKLDDLLEAITKNVYDDEENTVRYEAAIEDLKDEVENWMTTTGMDNAVSGYGKVQDPTTEEEIDVTFELLAQPKLEELIKKSLNGTKKCTDVEAYIAEYDKTENPEGSKLNKDLLTAMKDTLTNVAKDFYNNGEKKTLKDEDGVETTYVVLTQNYEDYMEKIEHLGMVENKKDHTWTEKKDLTADDCTGLCGEVNSETKNDLNGIINKSRGEFDARLQRIKKVVGDNLTAWSSVKNATENAPFDAEENEIAKRDDVVAIALVQREVETAIGNAKTQPELDKAYENGREKILKAVKDCVQGLLKDHYNGRLTYKLSREDYKALEEKVNAITLETEEETGVNALKSVIDVYNVDACKAMKKYSNEKLEQGLDDSLNLNEKEVTDLVKEDEKSANWFGEEDAPKGVSDLQSNVKFGDTYRVATELTKKITVKTSDEQTEERTVEVYHKDLTSGTLHYIDKQWSNPGFNAEDHYYMAFSFGIEGADIWNVKHNGNTDFEYVSDANKENNPQNKGKTIDPDNLVIVSSISKGTNEFKYEVTYGDDFGNIFIVVYHFNKANLTFEAAPQA